MAKAPNTDNYVLGRGRLSFARIVDGVQENERPLGNAPALTFSLEVERLDHFSSMSGLRSKDKTVVTQVTPTLSFTLDEINDDNLNLLFMGSKETVTQAADDDVATVLAAVSEGHYYSLDAREVGIWKVAISGTTGGPFQVGETLTGGTSSATATIEKISATFLYLSGITGTFSASETVTGGTSTATATAGGAQTFDTTDVVVFDTDTPTTFYVKGTDYSVDSFAGRILIPSGSGADGMNITVQYGNNAVTYHRLVGLQSTSVEGLVRFVSDYPEGPQMEARFWKVNLAPDGDTAFIGDDWSTIQFSGEILKDEENHPNEPYMELFVQ